MNSFRESPQLTRWCTFQIVCIFNKGGAEAYKLPWTTAATSQFGSMLPMRLGFPVCKSLNIRTVEK